MRYLGGKSRLGKKIAAKILEIVPPEHRIEYLEPFLGGAGAFEHIAPHFEKTYAGDVHEDLILMWQAVARGWVPPETVSEEEFDRLRTEAPSPLRAFARFGCAFGGVWLGGYARGGGQDYARGSGRSIGRVAAEIQRATTIARRSFFDWSIVPGVVLYCDPPYAGTAAYKGTSAFDSAAFWARAAEWASAGSYVFVSEFQAAPGWSCVLAVEKRRGLRTVGGEQGTMPDRLFFKGPAHFKGITW